MAVERILVSRGAGGVRAAFLDADGLVRLAIAADGDDLRPGDVWLGRIQRIEKSLATAFISLGGDVAGVLSLADLRQGVGTRPAVEGASVAVQVTRAAEPGKRAKLGTRMTLAGCYLTLSAGTPAKIMPAAGTPAKTMPAAGPAGTPANNTPAAGPGPAGLPAVAGAVFGWRSAARPAGDAMLADEAAGLVGGWQRIAAAAAGEQPPALLYRPPDAVVLAIADEAGGGLDRLVVDHGATATALKRLFPQLAGRLALHAAPVPLFRVEGVDAFIEAALEPAVPLPSGARLIIAETAACITVDVDSHRAVGGDAERLALAVDLEAAAALAREIRLRELAGRIVVDFLALKNRHHRTRLLEALAASMAFDRAIHVAGWTRLGLMEIMRPKRGPTLRDQLTRPCGTCGGTGRSDTAATTARGETV